MQIFKEVLFWWLLIDSILVIVKKWRKEKISYLKRLDKKF